MKQAQSKLSLSTDLSSRLPTYKQDLARLVASEAASLLYNPKEEFYSRGEFSSSHNEFALSDSDEERERLPSFRTSPKFQDVPVDRLAEFLKEQGLSALLPILQEHQVTFSELFSLTREDFAEMKISIGPRNRLLNALKRGQNVYPIQSNVDLSSTELDSPKQHSAPTIKPASPEKLPIVSINSSSEAEKPVRLHRRQLNEEVENFLQEIEDLLRKKTTTHAPKAPETVLQAANSSVSLQQMELLKSLMSDRGTIEKGLESLQRSISDLKENRDSRDASPIPRHDSSRGSCNSPKTKVPLNMKKGLASRLK